MNGTRQQIQYSLALEQADQGEAPVSGHRSARVGETRQQSGLSVAGADEDRGSEPARVPPTRRNKRVAVFPPRPLGLGEARAKRRPGRSNADINQPGVPEPPPIIPAPVIREPQVTETAIEAPWRLFLSPNYSRAWAHSATPVTLDNRTELWHARLAVRRRRPMGSQRTRRSRAGCAPSGRPITAREPSRLIRRSLR